MNGFKETISETNEVGTPQGGVISPLLANIALHGLEDAVTKQFRRESSVKVVRYADDFIITGKGLNDILKAKEIVIDFLKGINLELSEAKTRIGHSMYPMENNRQIGFDFLGFHFRNIKTSIHKGVKSTRGKMQEFRGVSSPSRESFMNHKKKIKTILREYKTAPLGALITRLSSTIQG